MRAAPNLWGYALRAAAAVGLTGMLCCVAPMVLFSLGLMGGVYAISFADWFYTTDGAPSAAAWALRIAAVGVGIASELEEGVFGWVTVNYLLEQLHNPRKSYVALDLGGGSTQITFLPKYEETFKTTPASFLHEVSSHSHKLPEQK